jgi:hypothetical protein
MSGERGTAATAVLDDDLTLERRAWTRHACNLATSCRLLAIVPGLPAPIRVRNISATGISLVVDGHFTPQAQLTIELKSTLRRVARTLPIRVVYCIEHPTGDSILGGRFLSPLTTEELRVFVG